MNQRDKILDIQDHLQNLYKSLVTCLRNIRPSFRFRTRSYEKLLPVDQHMCNIKAKSSPMNLEESCLGHGRVTPISHGYDLAGGHQSEKYTSIEVNIQKNILKPFGLRLDENSIAPIKKALEN